MSKIKFTSRLKSFFGISEIKPGYWEELEEILLTSDCGLESTRKLIDSIKDAKRVDSVKEKFEETAKKMLHSNPFVVRSKPHVIMVVGVNGSGKTTSIAKLANKLKKEGHQSLLIAADTFRAAAVSQLKVWGERLDVPVVAQEMGSDPAAVAFDGIESAKAKGVDVVILDTAGRIHTKKNLMDELSKVKRVVGKSLEGAPHDIFLTIDATVGQNGIMQAKAFHDCLGLTGIILTKMDGTAKGGVIFAISDKFRLPISYLGVGEGLSDLEEFRSIDFARQIFN